MQLGCSRVGEQGGDPRLGQRAHQGACTIHGHSSFQEVRAVAATRGRPFVERWTLLIIRDAFLGLRRFDQFQESLGIARNVLTGRLNWLVGEGILERVRYSERPRRHEYQLTPKGRDLLLPLTAFRQWGDKYLSQKPPTLLRRRSDSKPVVAALVPEGSGVLRAEQVELVPGPGATPGQDLWWRDAGNHIHASRSHGGRLSHRDQDAISR